MMDFGAYTITRKNTDEGTTKWTFSPSSDSEIDITNTMQAAKRERLILPLLKKHQNELSFSPPTFKTRTIHITVKPTDPLVTITTTKILDSAYQMKIVQNLAFPADVVAMQDKFTSVHMGKVLSELHTLELSDTEKETLTYTPLDEKKAQLERAKTHIFQYIESDGLKNSLSQTFENVASLLDHMDGKKVFVHSHFDPRSFSVDQNYGSPITHVFGFDHAGLGVKELDFPDFVFRNGKNTQGFFTSYQNKGEAPSLQNMRIMHVFQKCVNIHKDLFDLGYDDQQKMAELSERQGCIDTEIQEIKKEYSI